ncbi:MAG: hypothetical protein NXI32_10725 [bacterium]|nr:hypothetical protein [bacterium]
MGCRQNFAFPTIAGAVLLATTVVGQDFPSQELLINPRLSLEGPEQQLVYVYVRYFDDLQLTKTVTRRLPITADNQDYQLEFGHGGMRILVEVPTKQPVRVVLRDDDRKVLDATSDGIGMIELGYGTFPEDDAYQPDRVLLNEQEREFVQKVLERMNQGDTRDLVSSSLVANIEWQTLDAFCQSLQNYLGEMDASSQELDGWLSWQGNLGARVLAGPCQYASGRCLMRLSVIDGLLFDLEVESEAIPEDWFAGPVSSDEYVDSAEELAMRLVGGIRPENVEATRRLFAAQFRQSVTSEDLLELSATLAEKYGSPPQSIRFLASNLDPWKPGQAYRDYRIFHLLQMPEARACISETTIAFSSVGNRIGRGNLATVQITEAWPSAQPEEAASALAFLKAIGGQDNIADLFHEDIVPLLDTTGLKDSMDELFGQVGSIDVEPQLEMWEANQQANRTTAQGQVQFDRGRLTVRLDFSDKQLVGALISGPTLAWQSTQYIAEADRVEAIAAKFWESLLTGRAAEAHQLLAQKFREQFSLEDFASLLKNSDFAEPQSIERFHTDQVLISTRQDRPLAAMVSVYQLVELADGTLQPLRAEFARTDEAWELLNFNSDFQASFAGRQPHPGFEAFLASIQNGNQDQLLELLQPQLAESVQPQVLQAFLSKLRILIDPAFVPEQQRCWHDYRLGTRWEQLTTELKSKSGESIPVLAVFQLNQLASFRIQAEEMGAFVAEVSDWSCFDELVLNAIREWMAGNTQAASQFFSASLQNAELENQLNEIKSTLLVSHGAFQEAWVSSRSVSRESNRVLCWVTLRFERGRVPLRVGLQVDALGGRIDSLAPLEATP